MKSPKKTKKEEEVDPYQKEREKIKELDKILAEKENSYREMKYREKMRKLNDSRSDDLSQASVDETNKFFITEYKKKSKRMSVE